MARQKMQNKLFRFVFDATTLAITIPSDVNGWIEKMIAIVPSFTSTPSAVITITDPDGIVVFTSSSLSSGSTTTLGDLITAAEYGAVPIGEHPWSVTCTLNGVAGTGGGTVKFAVYLKG